MTASRCRDRRRAARLGRAECRVLSLARLRPGGEVRVLNLSPGGTAIDGTPRLVPGTRVDLWLEAPGWRGQATGRVVRCEVSSLSSERGASYRAGLEFDRRLDLPACLTRTGSARDQEPWFSRLAG